MATSDPAGRVFLVFFAGFVPYTFVLFGQDNREESFGQLYCALLVLVPFVILTLALCLWLGGTTRQTVIRTAVALLLVQHARRPAKLR